MKFLAMACLCGGALAAVACDGRGLPTSPSATASGLAATAPADTGSGGLAGTAGKTALLLTKTCDAIDHCTVITSSSGPIPVGSDINYFGPLLEARTSSSILVTTPAGDTAGGNCSLSYKSFVGTCVITGGTGKLAGLHANVKVSSDFVSDPAGVFTWEGAYHFAP